MPVEGALFPGICQSPMKAYPFPIISENFENLDKRECTPSFIDDDIKLEKAMLTSPNILRIERDMRGIFDIVKLL